MPAQAKERLYEGLHNAVDRRCRLKQVANLIVSAIILALGVSPFVCGRKWKRRMIFRRMTMDGTVFTSVGAVVFIAVNRVEPPGHTQRRRVPVDCIRPCSAAESASVIAALFCQFPPLEGTPRLRPARLL